MSKPIALITGASSGLGVEFARQFAQGGYDLAITARREQELESLAAELRSTASVEVIVADLSSPEGPRQIVERLAEKQIEADVLVNNAGFGILGDFALAQTERQLAMIRVNVEALTHLSHLLLPGMIERKRGGILNVASTAAFQPGPRMAVYFATKAYVVSFSSALAGELKGTGVKVTCLCPGPTETGFSDQAGMETTKLFDANVMTAAEVARIGYEAFRAGDELVIAGMRNRIGAFMTRLVPRSWSRAVTAAVLK